MTIEQRINKLDDLMIKKVNRDFCYLLNKLNQDDLEKVCNGDYIETIDFDKYKDPKISQTIFENYSLFTDEEQKNYEKYLNDYAEQLDEKENRNK